MHTHTHKKREKEGKKIRHENLSNTCRTSLASVNVEFYDANYVNESMDYVTDFYKIYLITQLQSLLTNSTNGANYCTQFKDIYYEFTGENFIISKIENFKLLAPKFFCQLRKFSPLQYIDI